MAEQRDPEGTTEQYMRREKAFQNGQKLSHVEGKKFKFATPRKAITSMYASGRTGKFVKPKAKVSRKKATTK